MPVSYTAIPDSDVDPESPITTALMTALRDNPQAIAEGATGAPRIQLAAMDANAVDQNVLTSLSVGQGELKTATQVVSMFTDYGPTSGYVNAVSSGSDYVLGAMVRATESGSGIASNTTDIGAGFGYRAVSVRNLSYTAYINLYYSRDDSEVINVTYYASFRYVTGSPPYDLGDGTCGMFVFAVVSPAGKVLSVSEAIDPPWAHNGPTKLVSSMSIAEKNIDMELIPHPFIMDDFEKGSRVVLVDPVSDIALSAANGEFEKSVAELLHENILVLDNTQLKRAAPPGVMPVSARWKISRI